MLADLFVSLFLLLCILFPTLCFEEEGKGRNQVDAYWVA